MSYLYSVYIITTTSKRNFCHGKPGTCIMALRTYVLISLLLIQYVSMVVQLRLSLARSRPISQVKHATTGQLVRSSIPQQAN